MSGTRVSIATCHTSLKMRLVRLRIGDRAVHEAVEHEDDPRAPRTAGAAAASALPMSSSLTSIGVASCGSSDRAVFSPMTDWVAIAIGTMAGIRRK